MDSKTEYIANLETQLNKASLAKRFVDSEEGKYVIDYMAELISSLTNKLLNTRRTNDEYIEIRAQIEILRKLSQVLTVQANETVMLNIREKLELAKEVE